MPDKKLIENIFDYSTTNQMDGGPPKRENKSIRITV